MNHIQQLLTLRNCIIACVEDLYVNTEAASNIARYRRVQLLITILLHDEGDEKLEFFH